mgnify:FL=1
MSHVKAGGSSKNNRNNAGQRLGVKRFGGQTVRTGEVLVRQTGSTKVAGHGAFISRDYTIHAAQDGIVTFSTIKKTRFTGKTTSRTQVSVV